MATVAARTMAELRDMGGLSGGYYEIFYLHWSPQPALPGVMFITRGRLWQRPPTERQS